MQRPLIGALVASWCWLWRAAKKSATSEKGSNGEHKIPGSLGFQHKSLRTGLSNFAFQHFRIVHGEHQNARAQVVLADTASGFKTAESWHGDIENNDVGFETLHRFDTIVGVGGFSADFPFGSGAG